MTQVTYAAITQPGSGFTLTIGGTTKKSRFTPVPVTINWADLPDEAKAFAIQYGVKQYLADGGAGAKDQAEFAEGVQERLAKLESGDFSRAKGERQASDSVEVVAKQVARERIDAVLKAKGVKPDKEQKAKLVEQYLEKYADQCKEEAERRIASRKVEIDLDLEDLLAAE